MAWNIVTGWPKGAIEMAAVFEGSVLRKGLCASVAGLMLLSAEGYSAESDAGVRDTNDNAVETRTPIKHLVIFFQENQTFDHYFGTYPHAANIPGEESWEGVPASQFHARKGTPSVNGLTPELLTNNPNVSLTGGQANPQRLRPADAVTCDMDHGYAAEQRAVNMGRMDKFVQNTGHISQGCRPDGTTVMDYFDGNTVTALWNYAQHYAMSDSSYDTNYGPTFPGHLNLISGNTNGGILHNGTTSDAIYTSLADGSLTVIGNMPAYLDDCGGAADTNKVSLEKTGKTIGDLLNARHITWGWFSGGFRPTEPAVLNPDGSAKTLAICGQSHVNHEFTVDGTTYVVPNPSINFTTDVHTASTDWWPDGIEPFMYYASTRNPHHLPPSSIAAIGQSDQANHQYDTSDFFAALNAGNLPAVSFVKPASYAWGHPGNSDPLVEQAWLVQSINAVMKSPEWERTAIVIAWDDSDGWYDHAFPPLVQPSNTALDFHCGNGAPAPGDGFARCGLGPRQPFLVISPWAKENYVDHSVIDQASILSFIERNWDLGYIDGPTALPAGKGSADRKAGPIDGMFDFEHPPHLHPLILDPIRGTRIADDDRHD